MKLLFTVRKCIFSNFLNPFYPLYYGRFVITFASSASPMHHLIYGRYWRLFTVLWHVDMCWHSCVEHPTSFPHRCLKINNIRFGVSSIFRILRSHDWLTVSWGLVENATSLKGSQCHMQVELVGFVVMLHKQATRKSICSHQNLSFPITIWMQRKSKPNCSDNSKDISSCLAQECGKVTRKCLSCRNFSWFPNSNLQGLATE